MSGVHTVLRRVHSADLFTQRRHLEHVLHTHVRTCPPSTQKRTAFAFFILAILLRFFLDFPNVSENKNSAEIAYKNQQDPKRTPQKIPRNTLTLLTLLSGKHNCTKSKIKL